MSLLFLLPLLLPVPTARASQQDAPTLESPLDNSAVEAGAGDPTLLAGSLRIDRGADRLPIWIPPGEELVFQVVLDLGKLGSLDVGSVTLASGVERYVPGLAGQREDTAQELKVGWLRGSASGGYLGYELDHEITTRINPQAWPRTILRDTQRGSENRRRELLLGWRDGAAVSSYRRDVHCQGCRRREHFVESSLPWSDEHHCDKCRRAEHRVWREGSERAVPEAAIDMLGAVYLARTFMRSGESDARLDMVETDRLWDVTLRRGKRRSIKTRAGVFSSSEILLHSSVPAGEEHTEREFAGLFGIRGELHLWMQDPTGVPVLIEGELPVGDLFDLKVSVVLKEHSGTPQAFARLSGR